MTTVSNRVWDRPADRGGRRRGTPGLLGSMAELCLKPLVVVALRVRAQRRDAYAKNAR